jgi:uncharacterized membrane protein
MGVRALIFALIVLALLLVVMFSSGMFMHGDPVEGI